MLDQKVKELLKILDMSEDEQYNWLWKRHDTLGFDLEWIDFDTTTAEKEIRRNLADLAFRLRDDFHYVLGSVVWEKACWDVWAHEKKSQGSNILDREHLSFETKLRYCFSWVSFWATPIHWIIIALIAKELMTDSDAKWEIEQESKVEETNDVVKYLKSIEWSMGCGGDRNEGQCPECCGPSKEWVEGANKNWMKQFGCKRVGDEKIGHTPECPLGNALKRSVPMYAIGQDEGDGGYGMWDGPNPSLREMLEVIGRDTNSVIIRFNVDGTDEVIYRWYTEWKQWNQQREVDVKEL